MASTILDFNSTVLFPDNRLLSQAYDLRVSQNDILKVSMKIMHQQPAYVREENLLGVGVYTWEPDFITMMDESFASGMKGNFSKVQNKVFSDYMVYLQNGLVPSTSEATKALDAYLGSRA